MRKEGGGGGGGESVAGGGKVNAEGGREVAGDGRLVESAGGGVGVEGGVQLIARRRRVLAVESSYLLGDVRAWSVKPIWLSRVTSQKR